MKLSDPDVSPEWRARAIDEIAQHTETLRAQFVESGNQARHYLLLTNSGAAVALLAFMGADASLRTAIFAISALCFFFGGVLSVGVLTAFDYHLKERMFNGWIADSKAILQGQSDVQQLFDDLNKRATRRINRAPAIAGYVAFACFISGAIIGVTGFLTRAHAQTSDQHFVLFPHY